MMDQNEARDYGIDLYTKNAVPYIRIAKIVARTPSRQPIKSSIARMRLVPIDSTEEVITEGLCSVNETNDPFVIGIVRPVGDSVQWHASHASAL